MNTAILFFSILLNILLTALYSVQSGVRKVQKTLI